MNDDDDDDDDDNINIPPMFILTVWHVVELHFATTIKLIPHRNC
jgi:hypothetical protein